METLNSKNLRNYLDLAFQSTQLGRKVLLDYFGRLSQVSEKKLSGLVSEADLKSEEVIFEFLKSKTPEFDLLGEESDYLQKKTGGSQEESAPKEGRWILDPLDGTTNYIYQFPIFCISLGLEVNGEVVVGVIDVPMFGVTYTCAKGLGAFKNDQAIHVSHRDKLKNCLLATGFIGERKEVLEHQLKIFNAMMSQARAIRRAGSAAFDLCMVAEGIFDGFWEESLSPWDTAAGSLLVREAGGQVTNYAGDEFNPDMKSILATNSKVHDILMDQINI